MERSFTTAYAALAAAGDIAPDKAQAAVVEKLEALAQALSTKRGLLKRKAPVRGLYIHGKVGRGKSMLMDLFFAQVPVKKKRRVHFHAFMLDIHARLNAWRKKNPGKEDPLPAIAAEVAKEAALLCFDEFQVTDIADAMILSRLFGALFAEDVTVVATSNRHPRELYRDGLQRDRFLPFIALLEEKLDIVELAGPKDYRLERMRAIGTVYFTPLGKKSDAFLEQTFAQLTGNARPKKGELQLQGRALKVPKMAGDVAWFSFAELCEAALGAADYIEVAREFTTLLLQDIPVLGSDNRNAAKRFVMLIDELYEHKTNLVCTAEASPEKLCPRGDIAFEFERTASRLEEMQSAEYLGTEHKT